MPEGAANGAPAARRRDAPLHAARRRGDLWAIPDFLAEARGCSLPHAQRLYRKIRPRLVAGGGGRASRASASRARPAGGCRPPWIVRRWPPSVTSWPACPRPSRSGAPPLLLPRGTAVPRGGRRNWLASGPRPGGGCTAVLASEAGTRQPRPASEGPAAGLRWPAQHLVRRLLRLAGPSPGPAAGTRPRRTPTRGRRCGRGTPGRALPQAPPVAAEAVSSGRASPQAPPAAPQSGAPPAIEEEEALPAVELRATLRLLRAKYSPAEVETRPVYLGFIPDLANIPHALSRAQARRWVLANRAHASLRAYFDDQGRRRVPFHLDHIVPSRLGGFDHPRNYAIMPEIFNQRFGSWFMPAKTQYLGPPPPPFLPRVPVSDPRPGGRVVS
eukprot:g13450.t1